MQSEPPLPPPRRPFRRKEFVSFIELETGNSVNDPVVLELEESRLERHLFGSQIRTKSGIFGRRKDGRCFVVSHRKGRTIEGALTPGDEILEINGHAMSLVSLETARWILKESIGSGVLRLVTIRDPDSSWKDEDKDTLPKEVKHDIIPDGYLHPGSKQLPVENNTRKMELNRGYDPPRVTRLIQQFETTDGSDRKTYSTDSIVARTRYPPPLEVADTQTTKKKLEHSPVDVNDNQTLRRNKKHALKELNDTEADDNVNNWKARHSLSTEEEDGIQTSVMNVTPSDMSHNDIQASEMKVTPSDMSHKQESAKDIEAKALFVGHVLMSRMNVTPSSSHESVKQPPRKKGVVTILDVGESRMSKSNLTLTSLDTNDVDISRKKETPKALSAGDIQTATVLKCYGGKKLGFSIVGGRDSPNGPIGVYIKTIHPNGLVAECDSIEEGDELLTVNDQNLQSLNHVEAVNVFRNLQNGPIRLTFRRTGLIKRVEIQRQDNSTPRPPSSFMHSAPSQSSSSGSYYSLISPSKFKSSNESNNSTSASLSLSRSDAGWKKLKDSLRMYGRNCPRVKSNSNGQVSSKSFFTHNPYRSLFPTQIQKDRSRRLYADDGSATNDGQRMNFTMKTQKNQYQSSLNSFGGNLKKFQTFECSSIHQQTKSNESVDSLGRGLNVINSTEAARKENGEETNQSGKSAPPIRREQINDDVGSRDTVDSNVQQINPFAASDLLAEWTASEEPFNKSRNRFDQKITSGKVVPQQNINCNNNHPDSDTENMDVSLKRWECGLNKDGFSSDGRNDLVKTSEVEEAMFDNEHRRDMMLLASPSRASNDNTSQGRPGTQDHFQDSSEGDVDSQTNLMEAENSFIYPPNLKEMDGKGNVQISKLSLSDRGSFKGVRTVSVTRLPGESLGLRLGVHSFIDRDEERVERVVVNEVTSGGAADRAGQDICPGDEIVSINNTIFYEQLLDNVMDFLREIPLKATLLLRRGNRSRNSFHSALVDTSYEEFGTKHLNGSKALNSLMNSVAKMFTDDSEELETPEQNRSDFTDSFLCSTNIHADNVNDSGAFKASNENWHFDSKPSAYHETENTDLDGTSGKHCINQNWSQGRSCTSPSLADSDLVDKFKDSETRHLSHGTNDTNDINAEPSKEPLSTNVGWSRTEKALPSAICVGLPGSRGKTRLGREFLGTIVETASTEEAEQDRANSDGSTGGRITTRAFSESGFMQPDTQIISQTISWLSGEKEGGTDIIPIRARPTLKFNNDNWREQEHSDNHCELPGNEEFLKTASEKCMELEPLADSAIFKRIAESNVVSPKSETSERSEVMKFMQSGTKSSENRDKQYNFFGKSSLLPNTSRWDFNANTTSHFAVDIASQSKEEISALSKTDLEELVDNSRSTVSKREIDSIGDASRCFLVSDLSRSESDSANETQFQEPNTTHSYKTSSADYSGTGSGITVRCGSKAGVGGSDISTPYHNKTAVADLSAKGSTITIHSGYKTVAADYSANGSGTTTSQYANKARVADNHGNGSGSLDDGFEDDDVIVEDNTETGCSHAPKTNEKRITIIPRCPTGYDKENPLYIACNKNEQDGQRNSNDEGILSREQHSLPKDVVESGIRVEHLNNDDKMFDKSQRKLSGKGNNDKQGSLAQTENLRDSCTEYRRQWIPFPDSKVASKQWNKEQWSSGRGSLESIMLDATKRNRSTERYLRTGSLEKKHDAEKDTGSEKKNGDPFKDGGSDILQDRNRWLVRLPPPCSRDLDQQVPADLGNLSIQSPNFTTVSKRQLTNLTPRPTLQPPNFHSDKRVELTNSSAEYKISRRPVSDPLPAVHKETFYCDETKGNEADLTKDLCQTISMNTVKPPSQEKIKTQRSTRSAYEILARFEDGCDVTSGKLSHEKWEVAAEDEEDKTSPPPLPTTAPPDFPLPYDSNFP